MSRFCSMSKCGSCGLCGAWDFEDDYAEPIGCEFCGLESCEGGCVAHIEMLEDETSDAAYDARIDNDLDLDGIR